MIPKHQNSEIQAKHRGGAVDHLFGPPITHHRIAHKSRCLFCSWSTILPIPWFHYFIPLRIFSKIRDEQHLGTHYYFKTMMFMTLVRSRAAIAVARNAAVKRAYTGPAVDFEHYASGWNVEDIKDFTGSGRYSMQTFNKISSQVWMAE